MANLTLVQAINLALIQEMERDERVLLLGEDVGANGGVFRVTEGLHKRFGGKRVVGVGRRAKRAQNSTLEFSAVGLAIEL